ncbi:MAG TPA: sterol desaturase family protein [Solirubrobacteraceae bacterium]|nr:sterol desaturase family protein [Solirubrobacteraceae bacterium]
MFDLILYAAPFFVMLLIVEWLTFRHASEDAMRGYDVKDTATSLSMGAGNLVINLGWKLVVVAIYSGVYELTPLRVPSDAWWAWVLLFFADDLAYYWFHRISHEVRVFWASHVVHHSSRHYNLSTALRQTWVPMTAFPFWLPLAVIGIKPWMIVLEQSVSLTYQFFIHTERVARLPPPIEAVLNTPSHHRAHHGANQIYLDKNYGGILIIWDRLLGTFQGETEAVRYGLTKNIATHNPARVAFHEYAAIARDVRRARGWRERLGYAFGGPGWEPPSRAGLRAPVPAALNER